MVTKHDSFTFTLYQRVFIKKDGEQQTQGEGTVGTGAYSSGSLSRIAQNTLACSLYELTQVNQALSPSGFSSSIPTKSKQLSYLMDITFQLQFWGSKSTY